jgi:hypothetical protein
MARGDKSSQRNAQDLTVDVVPNRREFILRVGPVFVSLDRPTTEELLYLLAEALEISDPLGITTGSN